MCVYTCTFFPSSLLLDLYVHSFQISLTVTHEMTWNRKLDLLFLCLCAYIYVYVRMCMYCICMYVYVYVLYVYVRITHCSSRGFKTAEVWEASRLLVHWSHFLHSVSYLHILYIF